MSTKTVSEEERQPDYNPFEEVTVDLRRSYTYPSGGKSYGPGQNIKVPRGLADSMGLVDKGEQPAAAGSGEGEDYESWSKEDLAAEAEKRGLTVKRADGAEGKPVKSDYVEALSKKS